MASAARLTEKIPGLQVVLVKICKDGEPATQTATGGTCGYFLGYISKQFCSEEILQAIADSRLEDLPTTGGTPQPVNSHRQLSSAPESSAPKIDGLTKRETEVFELLAEGLSNKEIAQKTGISVGTVRTHVAHILSKLGVRCRTEAAAAYFRSQRNAAAVA